MYTVVGVRFKAAGKIYYFDPGEYEIEKDQYIIVETVRGIEHGKVVISNRSVSEEDVVLPLKKVIRLANEEDSAQATQNQMAAKEAFAACTEKIKEHILKMKLIDVEYTFDRNKIIFYFTAEGRVD
ncbi:MAG: regulatory iron-sulfur-containing complex subunit RicT, partial [Bacilli bacterium]